MPCVPVAGMLARAPTRRAAKNERERGVLRNAVEPPDRKTADLVDELHSLKPDKFALVKGAAK